MICKAVEGFDVGDRNWPLKFAYSIDLFLVNGDTFLTDDVTSENNLCSYLYFSRMESEVVIVASGGELPEPFEELGDGVAVNEDIVDELEASVDALDEEVRDSIEEIARAGVALRAHRERKTSHLVDHEGGQELIVFVDWALIVAFVKI